MSYDHGNTIAYYKSTRGRNDGSIKSVDLTRGVMRHSRSFGSVPFYLEVSTKEEFHSAYLTIISQ